MTASTPPRPGTPAERAAADAARLERAPFVASLRARPDTIRVADGGEWMVRVQSLEMWDTVRLETSPSATVREVKEHALAALLPDGGHPGEFVTKLNGIEVLDEEVSLADAGVLNGSTLLLTYRRRQPVR
jgi:hypothetical protein